MRELDLLNRFYNLLETEKIRIYNFIPSNPFDMFKKIKDDLQRNFYGDELACILFDRIYIKEIPNKLIKKALKKFKLPKVTNENILVLIDNHYLFIFTNIIVFTQNTFYCKGFGLNSNMQCAIKYEDIEDIFFEKRTIPEGFETCIKLKSGYVFKVYGIEVLKFFVYLSLKGIINSINKIQN